MRPLYLLRIGLICLYMFFAFSPETGFAQTEKVRRVLILNSYQPGFDWTESIVDGIRAEFDKRAGDNVELVIEYMDTKRHNPTQILPYFKELYLAKYQNTHFDVVITSDNNALDFALKNRDQLFPHTPLVFSGINDFSDALIAGHSGITGVVEDIDIAGTLELALQLHPDTENVAVISDLTQTDAANRARLERLKPEFQPGLHFIDLVGLPPDELRQALAQLPPRTVILLFNFYRDSKGGTLSLAEGVSLVTTSSNLPVYSMWQDKVESGVLGGIVISGQAQGKHAAQMAIQILRGRSPDDIPILRQSPNIPMFNYAQLQRFGLAPSDLPQGTVLLNEPTTFYYQYRNYIFGGLIFIAIQTLIIITLWFNMTRRRQAEKAFQESERKYRLLVENAGEVVLVAQERLLKFINRKVFDLLGYRAEELIDKPFTDYIHPKDRQQVVDRHLRRLQGVNLPDVYSFRVIDKAGQTRWIELNSVVIEWEGKPATLNFLTDITERRQTEEALRQERNKAQKYLDIAGVMFVALNARGEVILINQKVSEVLGYAQDEIIGQNWFDNFLPAGIQKTVKDVFDKLMSGTVEPVKYYENPILTSEGEERIIAWHNSLLTDEAGVITGILSSGADITEHKRAEEALRKSEERLNVAQRIAKMGDFTWNVETGEVSWSEAMFELLQYDKSEKISYDRVTSEIHHPDDLEQITQWVNEAINSGQEELPPHEYRLIRQDGQVIYVRAMGVIERQDGAPPTVFATLQDITQRKLLEEENVRQERLAAVGQLAAGIAHDFNNILTTVIGYSELLQLEPNLTPVARADLKRIVQQSQRAARLIRQILDFSRQTINEPRPLDLRSYLTESLKFIERTIPETIQIRFNCRGAGHTINADPTQLQQVITNLAVNARDAMPDGGTLAFDLCRLRLAPDEPPPCPDMESGEWVRLTVTDNGTGIAPEDRPHIFEPFFTTKEIGQGAGLGLAQVYGIVMQHEGCITVHSQLGEGATFNLYFPAMAGESIPESQIGESLPMGQGETILLVEDETVVLDVARTMLEKLNYEVIVARNGTEALTVYRAQADRIGLVLTDVVMPGMDGFALTAALQGEAPGIPVLLMSGYARPSESTPETTPNISGRLQKPLSIYQLAQALQKALVL